MSDFLERNGLQTVAQHFKDLFLASVHRDGAEELLERLEQTAERLQKTFGLDGDIMDEYRSKVESAKEVRRITSQLYPAEAKQVRDTIYEMCDRLDDPKEVMKHVRTAGEIIDIWDPEK